MRDKTETFKNYDSTLHSGDTKRIIIESLLNKTLYEKVGNKLVVHTGHKGQLEIPFKDLKLMVAELKGMQEVYGG